MFWGLLFLLAFHLGIIYLLKTRHELRDPLFHERVDLIRRHVAITGEENPPLVMMIGTSRTGNAFHARQMQDQLRGDLKRPVVAFNVGIANTGPIMQHIYLQRLLDRKLKPNVLILEILPSFYIEEGGMARERDHLDVTRVALDEIAEFESEGVSLDPHKARWKELWLNPWGEMRFHILHQVRPSWVPSQVVLNWNVGCDPWGWRPTLIEKMPPDVYAKALERAINEHGRHMKNACIDPQTLNPLIRTLELCRREGIPVVLVHLPEDSNFREWYTPKSKRGLEETFSRLAKDHGAQWIDATEWVPDGHFYDGHHMLQRGAELFTERMANEGVLPILNRQGATP